MTLYNKIIEDKKKNKKTFALLVDPDRQDKKQLMSVVDKANKAEIDYFFVGGSLLTNDNLDLCISTIKNSISAITDIC